MVELSKIAETETSRMRWGIVHSVHFTRLRCFLRNRQFCVRIHCSSCKIIFDAEHRLFLALQRRSKVDQMSTKAVRLSGLVSRLTNSILVSKLNF